MCRYMGIALALLATLTSGIVLAEDRKHGPVVLETKDLLTPPEGLKLDGLTVAKTPPRVEVLLIPDLPPVPKGGIWSSWGDGCLASNGKYYTAIGDHGGKDATSYVYEYDPAKGELKKVIDVAKAIDQKPGVYGHGKIHSGIHEASDGRLYFATYWGKHREVEAAFGPDYQGSILMRYDPKTGKTENLGAIVPKQGLPASHFERDRGLLYFHAVYKGDVVVYDIKAGKVIFQGGADATEGHRTFMSDGRGRVYFTGGEGKLLYHDAKTNTLGKTEVKLSSSLRAAARPTRDGLLYGMTQKGELFVFNPAKETVMELGGNIGEGDYTAVMVLSPDEKYLYYAPGAHGSSVKHGTAVVQYEIATGKRKALAFLNATGRRQLGWNFGGTYNLQIDGKGERLFCTFNGAPWTETAKKVETFGQPAVVVLQVPAAER